MRGIDVLTAQEDGYDNTPDPQVLDRATELGRVLFTRDDDLLKEARDRQVNHRPFTGVIYVHQTHIALGPCIEELELITTLGQPNDFINQV